MAQFCVSERVRSRRSQTPVAVSRAGSDPALSELQMKADQSSTVAQLKRFQSLADGDPIQRMPEEDEELMQGKGMKDPVQRMEKEDLMQGKGLQMPLQHIEEEDLMQGKGIDAPVQRVENSGGLPSNLQTNMEQMSGTDLSDVRVHRNSAEPAKVGALAYAQGRDIHLGAGQEKHLPHEAWHVVQQAQGRVKPTMQMKGGVAINDDAGLEAEADQMGAQAMQMKAQFSDAGSQPQADLKPLCPNNQPTLQGKFGFEIETRVVATAATQDRTDLAPDEYISPDGLLDDEPKLGMGAGFALHLDHVGSFKRYIEGGPIIELVTEPAFDEATESEGAVAAKMQTMVDTANALATNATTPKKLGSVANVNSVGPKTGYFLFAGAPGVGGQKAHGYVQATLGAKLASVPQLFEHIASDELKSSSKDSARLKRAVTISAEMFTDVESQFKAAIGRNTGTVPDGWSAHIDDAGADATNDPYYYHNESDKSQWDMPDEHDAISHDFLELKGFLALLANYIIAARTNTGDKEESANLIKNLIGQVFFKTSLATVRDNLRGYSKTVVEDSAWRTYLKNVIVAKTGVDESKPLTRVDYGAVPTVGVYIDNVLNGTSDWIFDRAKNPYSAELIDSVGETGRQAPAVVMENRRVVPVGGTGASTEGMSELEKRFARMAAGGGVGKHAAPSEWVGLARQYHQIAKAINAPVPRKPD